MGPLAVQQSQSPRQKQRADTAGASSTHSSPAHPNMACPAVFPPLNLRSTSGGRMPFPRVDGDSTDDAERRNATALTIVELLARGSGGNSSNNNNSNSSNNTQTTLPPCGHRPRAARRCRRCPRW